MMDLTKLAVLFVDWLHSQIRCRLYRDPKMTRLSVVQLISFFEVLNSALVFFDAGSKAGPYKDLMQEVLSRATSHSCYLNLRDRSTLDTLEESSRELSQVGK